MEMMTTWQVLEVELNDKAEKFEFATRPLLV
jgi:hypothetical protein